MSCGEKIPENATRKASKRIFGGKESQPGEWPWMVTIMTKRSSGIKPTKICGGAILSKHFILTAAHCFSKSFTFKVGNNSML